MDLTLPEGLVAVIKWLRPLLLVFFIIGSITEKVMAAGNHIAYKFFNYGDSEKTKIFEHLFLYTTDLTVDSSLSFRYGLDGVSAPSFGTVTAPSGQTVDASKYRNSAGVSFSSRYTDTLQGVTGLDVSTKSDYSSFTLGQSLNTPILNEFFTMGLAAYYTASTITPTPTDNVLLKPPAGDLTSQQTNYLISLEHILSNKSKIKLLLETFNINGYLSTGYHYVTVSSGLGSPQSIENLPKSRTGEALTAVLSQGLTDKSAIHLRIRGYNDTFGITAYSGDITYRTYIQDATILEGVYRYYRQNAANFWASSFATMPTGYYSSQTALAPFSANQLGLGVRHEFIFDQRSINFSGILSAHFDLYLRNDGTSFNTFSAGIESDF